MTRVFGLRTSALASQSFRKASFQKDASFGRQSVKIVHTTKTSWTDGEIPSTTFRPRFQVYFTTTQRRHLICLLAMAGEAPQNQPEHVSITPLLKRLAYPTPTNRASAEEIASAFALVFENRLTTTQLSAFLTLLHSTGRDKDPEVIAKCATRMREAANQVEKSSLRAAIGRKALKLGSYRGGPVKLRLSPGPPSRINGISSVTLSVPAATLTRHSTSRLRLQS